MGAAQLVYLSAERTLLTWVRLALTIMGSGFLLDRFGLILSQENLFDSLPALPRFYSLWGGIVLILLGVAASLLPALYYARYMRSYTQAGYTVPVPGGMKLGLILSVLVALTGLTAIAFLMGISGTGS